MCPEATRAAPVAILSGAEISRRAPDGGAGPCRGTRNQMQQNSCTIKGSAVVCNQEVADDRFYSRRSRSPRCATRRRCLLRWEMEAPAAVGRVALCDGQSQVDRPACGGDSDFPLRPLLGHDHRVLSKAGLVRGMKSGRERLWEFEAASLGEGAPVAEADCRAMGSGIESVEAHGGKRTGRQPRRPQFRRIAFCCMLAVSSGDACIVADNKTQTDRRNFLLQAGLAGVASLAPAERSRNESADIAAAAEQCTAKPAASEGRCPAARRGNRSEPRGHLPLARPR